MCTNKKKTNSNQDQKQISKIILTNTEVNSFTYSVSYFDICFTKKKIKLLIRNLTT